MTIEGSRGRLTKELRILVAANASMDLLWEGRQQNYLSYEEADSPGGTGSYCASGARIYPE